MGQVLAVVSQKGGVGKTTTAVNLATALARRGVKTLLVDSDPQGSVRYGLGLSAAATRLGLSDYLAGTHQLHQVVRTTTLPWLRVVSAGSVTDTASHDALSTYGRRVAAHGRAVRARARARIHRDRRYAAGAGAGRQPGVWRAASTCSSRCSASRSRSRRRRRFSAAFARRWARIRRSCSTAFCSRWSRSGIRRRSASPTYVREQLPAGLVLELAVPRTQASVEAFAAGQPVVLRSPEDPAAQAYRALAALLVGRLE